jgi:hypothetical protein
MPPPGADIVGVEEVETLSTMNQKQVCEERTEENKKLEKNDNRF